MKSIRRIVTGLISSFEGIVGHLENHEALVTTAIHEAERASARAKAQLNRVHKDGQVLRAKITELQELSLLWEQRAKEIAAHDEQKAIECVRRRESHRAQAAKLEEQALAHVKLERQLNEDLAAIQEKLGALRQQRNILRTRESKAEALRAVHGIESSTLGEIDDIFDRWEARIVACESVAELSPAHTADILTEEFTSREQEAHLREILRSLTSHPGDH